MFLLIFGIEGHGTQLYFDICELPIGVTFWLAPFLHSLRARTWLLVLPLLPLTMTPRFTLRPRDFEGSTANLQTGNCLGLVCHKASFVVHSCVSTCRLYSFSDLQTEKQQRWTWLSTCNMYVLKMITDKKWPITDCILVSNAHFSQSSPLTFAKLPLINITDQFSLSNCCYPPCYQTGFCISIIQVYMDDLCVLIV